MRPLRPTSVSRQGGAVGPSAPATTPDRLAGGLPAEAEAAGGEPDVRLTADDPAAGPDVTPATSFAEVALRLSGKSDDEAGRMGAIDRADDLVEGLYEAKRQTAASPLHRIVWDRDFDVADFAGGVPGPPPDVRAVMDASLAVVRRHKAAGTLLDEHRKVAPAVLGELGRAGYWGLLVPRAYGGTEARFADFARFLTTMATVDPTVAGLASVHGCIGAVDPVATFGTEEQKRRFLPRLASG